MIIFVLIAGFFQGILEGLLNLGISSGFSWLYESITRREAPFRDGYRTEYKKYIGFKAARKFCYLGGTKLAYFNYRLPKTLELFGGKETVADFQFKVCDKFTVMLPPQTIPFELFHFIVLDFADHRIETVGVVRTLRTAYTVYRDWDSEGLMGQTGKGTPFFITLTDNYSKRQFLRVNRNLKTNPEFSPAAINSRLIAQQSALLVPGI